MADKYEDEMPYAEVGSPTRQLYINIPARQEKHSVAPPLPPRRQTTLPKSSEDIKYNNTTSVLRDRHDSRGHLTDSQPNLHSNNLSLNRSFGSTASVHTVNDISTFPRRGFQSNGGSPETNCSRIYYSINSSSGGLNRVPSEYQLFSDLPISRGFQNTTTNHFVSTKRLESDENISGIFVKDSLHFPSENWSQTIDELIALYIELEMEDSRKQDFKRHIVTRVLPRLRRTDIAGMTKLLHIGSKNITEIVVPVLIEETIEIDLRSVNVVTLYQAFNSVVEVFTNSSLDLLLVLFNLASIIRMKYNENQKPQRKNICKKCLDRCKSLSSFKMCNSMNALKLFTEQFKSSTKWELPRSNTEGGKSLQTMNFVDLYSYLYGLLNKIFLSVKTTDNKYVDELKRTTAHLVEKKHKPQSDSGTIQEITLRLITTACFLLLKNDAYLELQSEETTEGLFTVLDLILMNSNVLQETRISLMTVLEPLLLVENKKTITRILQLFIKNHQTSVPISRLVQQYISKELLHAGIKISDYSCLNEIVPTWLTTKGVLSYNEKEILLHCLMPTLSCLCNGKITEYKTEADQQERNFHLNNLRILTYLQDGKTHNSVIQLLAYQFQPLPLFYITERMSSLTLNEFLLRKRKQSKWQPNKMLTSLVLEIVDVVIFLKDRGIIHRDLTSHAFRICDGGQRIVLHDFSIALMLEGKDFIQADDNHLIPTLWSAPESILEDKYNVKSDAWMVGHLLYEIFTHGCQPYTEMYTFGIDKVLSYVVFHNLQPKQWQCIPKCIFELIIALLQRNPEDRCDLSEIQNKLKETIDMYSSQGSKRRHHSLRHEEDTLYPSIDPKQDIPMRGIPQLFLQMKKQTITRSDHLYNAYTNLKIEERRSQITEIQIQISELTAPDRPRVNIEDNHIHVREPVTTNLIDKIRSHLESDTFNNVLKMKYCPTWTKTDGQSDTYLLDYSMDCRTSVMEIANSRHFGDPSNDIVKKKNIELILKMVKFVMEMNSCSWILGSVRCADMYLSNENDQVVMARLGRMLWFDRSGLEDDYVIASQDCTDNMRWCPVEVLQFKQYSFASDVYSLAMTIYEFFMTLSVNQRDPMAGELESAPFPYVALEDLRDHLFRDGKPDQPEACPEWLYVQMCRCWSKDKDKRPTCEQLFNIIEKHLRSEENVSEQDQYDMIPEQKDNNDQYEDIIENGATNIANLAVSEMEGDNIHYQSIPFDCVNSDSDSDENEIVLQKQQQKKTKAIYPKADANTTDGMEYGFVRNTDNESESTRVNSVVFSLDI
ncbi:uncharacterized protein LOC127701994 isoform X2 [Mytilus californianus]|uniref:uncharacterized protein LOC127701994 isoform X2 n=1 Tax=Mytilus californianus TaxID=6549 RepID=UPI002247C44E|nr:uncharacterized protein LOC127701994 isoform X2 [Mytilus californianus]